MLVTNVSMISGKEHTMDLPVTEQEMAIWCSPNPPLIQDCFPNLTDEQREFILTGITPEEWNNVFPPEEE